MGRSVTKTTSISEATQQKVDNEIRRILEEQSAEAQNILENNRDKMEAMTTALMKWETIGLEQVEDIMAGREPQPPQDWTPRLPPRDGGGSNLPPALPEAKPTPTPG